MRPFDVQSDLLRPAGVGPRQGRAAILIYFRKGWWVRQPQRLIEHVQVGGDVRIVVSVDNGDRLAGAIGGRLAECSLIKAVGMAYIGGSQSEWPGIGGSRGR